MSQPSKVAAWAVVAARAEFAVDDVGDDFHIVVAVGVESRAGADDVVIEHAEDSELHVVGVVVFGEGEVEVAVEPSAPHVSHFGMVDVSFHIN